MVLENVLEEALTRGRFSSLAAVTDPAARAQCLQALKALQQQDVNPADRLEQQLAANGVAALSRRELNILSLTDQLFSVCAQQSELDGDFLNRFLQLKPLVAQVLLAQKDLSAAGTSPALLLIDTLWDAARYWGPELGRAADRYHKRLADRLAELRVADAQTAPFDEWEEEISSQVEKDLQRAELLSARICESEKGQQLTSAADGMVVRAINTLLARAPMPQAVEDLLKGAFFQSLKLAYLQGSETGDSFMQLMAAGELLVDSVQFDGSASRSAELYKIIPQVPELLKPALIGLNTPAERSAALDDVDKVHMNFLLEGKMEGLRPATLLAEPGALADAAQVGQQVLAQVERLNVGQWLVYSRDNGESLRCRLAMKLPGKVIFTNLLGAKCLEKTEAEFAYLLTAKEIRLLNQKRSFAGLLEDVFEQISQLFQRQLMLHTEQQARKQREHTQREQAQLKAKQEAERLQQEEAARKQAAAQEAAARAEAEQAAKAQAALAAAQAKAQAEAAQAAAQAQAEAQARHAAVQAQAAQVQAEAEAKAQADAQRAAALQAAAAAEQDKQQELLNACMQQVNSLASGAWLDLEQDGQWIRVKLAAILPSTDKFILAGRDGKKLAEPKREELAAWLAADRVRVIDGGAQFENSLAKVIQTLRSE